MCHATLQNFAISVLPFFFSVGAVDCWTRCPGPTQHRHCLRTDALSGKPLALSRKTPVGSNNQKPQPGRRRRPRQAALPVPGAAGSLLHFPLVVPLFFGLWTVGIAADMLVRVQRTSGRAGRARESELTATSFIVSAVVWRRECAADATVAVLLAQTFCLSDFAPPPPNAAGAIPFRSPSLQVRAALVVVGARRMRRIARIALASDGPRNRKSGATRKQNIREIVKIKLNCFPLCQRVRGRRFHVLFGFLFPPAGQTAPDRASGRRFRL